MTILCCKNLTAASSQMIGHTDFCHIPLEPALLNKNKSFIIKNMRHWGKTCKRAISCWYFACLFIYGEWHDPYAMQYAYTIQDKNRFGSKEELKVRFFVFPHIRMMGYFILGNG